MKRLYFIACIILLTNILNVRATLHHLHPYDLALQNDGSDSSDNGNDYNAAAQSEDYDSHPQYSFAYNVHDALTGDEKQQEEQRNGDVVLGQYSVIDPDGTRRVVEYSADDKNGFNAVVSKQSIYSNPRFAPTTLATGSLSSTASSSRYNSNSIEAMQSAAQNQAQLSAESQAQAAANAQSQANAEAQLQAMTQAQRQTEYQAKVQAENQARIQQQQLMEQTQQLYRQQAQAVQRSQQHILRARAQASTLGHSLHAAIVAHPNALLARSGVLTQRLAVAHPALIYTHPASAAVQAHVVSTPILDSTGTDGAYTYIQTNNANLRSQW